MTASDSARTARVVLVGVRGRDRHVVKHAWFEQLVPSRWRGGAARSARSPRCRRSWVVSRCSFPAQGLARWTNLAMLVPTSPAAAAQINHPGDAAPPGFPQLAPVRLAVQTLVAAVTWWANPNRPWPNSCPTGEGRAWRNRRS